MNKYKKLLTPSPFIKAGIYFIIGIAGIFIIVTGIFTGSKSSIPYFLLVLLMFVVSPVAFIMGCIHLFNSLAYLKTIRIAESNDLDPTWGYGKKGFLLVDPNKKMLVCNGHLFLFDGIQTISLKATDEAAHLQDAHIPSIITTRLWIVGRDGRIAIMGCRNEYDATSFLARLSDAIGMERF